MEFGVFSQLANAGLALLLAVVLFVLLRRHRRSYIRQWALAWTAIGGSLLSAAVASAMAQSNATEWPRIVAAISHTALGYVGALWLLSGMYELAKGAPVPRRTRLVLELCIVVFAVAITLGTTDATWQTRLFLRVGLRDAVLGVAFLGVSAGLPAFGIWRSGLSRRVVVALLALYGLQHLHYAVIFVLWLDYSVPPPGYFEFMGMIDLVCLAAMGMGLLLWLLEVEWERATAAEQQLVRSQKLEGVGLLAGGIAHDFNNLLHVILGSVGYAGSSDGKERSDAIQSIRVAAERAADLTGQLLAFSRRRPIVPVPTNLNELIEDMGRMIRPMMTASVEWKCDPGAELAVVNVDPAQIEQVLVNLCANAKDAMPAGGRVTIATDNVQINGNSLDPVPQLPPGCYVRLSVSDTGEGMEEEVHTRAFEPFFTTKDQGKGTGLGLSSVHGIIEQHGGATQIRSEVDVGTSVDIYLPSTEHRVRPTTGPTDTDSTGGHGTILVAEDNSMVRDLTRRVLETAGYRVLGAADGNEAIRILDRELDAIDLALLDVVMPACGGREVLEHIIARKMPVAVMFLTGYGELDLPTKCLKERAITVLSKPVESSVLLRELRRSLDAHRGLAGGHQGVGA